MAIIPFQPLTPTSVLCVGAHADDIETFMGGTVAKYAAAGATVDFLILTDGRRGGSHPEHTDEQMREMRRTEQQAAVALLGVHSVTFADFKDGELALSDDVKKTIVRAIRRTKPQVVLCIDPSMVYSLEWGMINHIDHRIAGEAVLAAVYPLACNAASYPELLDEGLAPHKTATVLLAHCDTQNFIVDISEYMEAKLSAMKAHQSQADSLQEVLKLVQATAEQMAARAGARYAEAFVRLDLRI